VAGMAAGAAAAAGVEFGVTVLGLVCVMVGVFHGSYQAPPSLIWEVSHTFTSYYRSAGCEGPGFACKYRHMPIGE
jgi:hypothetical protein